MIDLTKKYEKYVYNKTVYNDGKLIVRSLGVTSLLFDDGKTKILFDFMVSRPSLIQSGLMKLDSNKKLVHDIVNSYHLKDIKSILVSHSHYDHVLDVPNMALYTGADVYGSLSTLNICRGNGVDEDKLVEFKAGNTYEIDDFKITVLKSIHSKPGKFNNDLGIEIEKPLKMPAKMKYFTEGGSFDFYIEYHNKRILIRPSCNYIEGQLDNINCDVLFLGIGQLSKMDQQTRDKFYYETVKKTRPQLVIPVHWDNFFAPIEKANTENKLFDHTSDAMDYMIERLERDGIAYHIIPIFHTVLI